MSNVNSPFKRMSNAAPNNGCVNPEDYARIVATYAQQTIGTSIFPGEIFEDLAYFLRREFDQRGKIETDIALHTFSVPEMENPAFILASDTLELDKVGSSLPCDDVKNRIQRPAAAMIFMRGHQPPECLTRIGYQCSVDPLFFQRHLQYRWASRPSKLFCSPSLPSASHNTIRLRLITLGERGENVSIGSASQIQHLRSKSTTDMANYLHDVNREYKLVAGNSIVREFNVHNARYFSIEQEVTVMVQAKGKGWLALVWTDVGTDLGNGPDGPWHIDGSRKAPKKSPFFPTIHYLGHGAPDRPLSTLKVPDAHQARGPFAQSISLLAHNYGASLDPALLSSDSFYALSELFATSASSINQLLNLIENIIDQKTGYKLYESRDYSLADLSYHQDILNRLDSRLRENVFDLDQHDHTSWPRTGSEPSAESQAKATSSTAILLADFQRLLSRVEHLAARCQSGMAICMNSAAIAESQRAIEQAQQVGQLTRLAFIYVPLSFTTSFFGMNLAIFGTGNLKLWIWFAVSIPLGAVSYVILALLSGNWW